MKRTQVVFVAIILLALVVVGVSLYLRQSGGITPLVESQKDLTVRIVCALPVEAVRARGPPRALTPKSASSKARLITVEVVPMDGLTAMGRYDRGEMNPLPTVWIPDSRYLVELVNAGFKESPRARCLSHRRRVSRAAHRHLAL